MSHLLYNSNDILVEWGIIVKKKVEIIVNELDKEKESRELDVRNILKLSKEADQLLSQFVEENKIVTKG